MLLGIDVGTSSCKVALFDNSGKQLASESVTYSITYPHPGWAEQDPETWWNAAISAIGKLMDKSGASPAKVDAIGVDGQSGAAVAIGRDGACLCPTPIWLDIRSQDICQEAEQAIGEKHIFSVAGNKLRPAYSTPKILWYKRYFPEIYTAAYRFLQSNSYIVYKLTGKFSQDVSQGYGLHFFDNRRLIYNCELCKEFGFEPDKFPEIYRCSDVVGSVTEEAAKACGLISGIPVIAGGLDAACAALSAGVCEAGQTQEQSGQAGGMSICTDFPAANPGLISSAHVVPGRWLLQGGTTGGAGVLRWLQKELWPDMDFDSLCSLADSVPAGSDGVLFLPYMSGERSPIWLSNATGIFFGLSFGKTRGHLIRAAMEGVAFSLQHNLSVAESCGISVGKMVAVGGASKSSVWNQIKADVTGKEIYVCSNNAGSVFGASILAAIGAGMCVSPKEMLEKNLSVSQKYLPDRERQLAYSKCMELYLRLLERNMDLFLDSKFNT